MKTLAFAAAAVALIAAPAFAGETAPNAGSSSTPASATALNPAQHTFKIGQRVPASFVAEQVRREGSRMRLAWPSRASITAGSSSKTTPI